jgi:hypothetical protein
MDGGEVDSDDDDNDGYVYSEDDLSLCSDGDEEPRQLHRTKPPTFAVTALAEDDRRGRGSKNLSDGVSVVLERSDVRVLKEACRT